MKPTDFQPRNRFLWLYGLFLVIAAVATVAVVNDSRFILHRDYVAAQFVLTCVTGLSLMTTVEGSAPLKRGQALAVLVLSTVVNILCHAAVHWSAGIINTTQNETVLDLGDFVYFSMVTFTTLGFGDLQPVSETRLAAAFQAMSGYLYLGLFIGLMTGGFKPASNGTGSDHESGKTQQDYDNEKNE